MHRALSRNGSRQSRWFHHFFPISRNSLSWFECFSVTFGHEWLSLRGVRSEDRMFRPVFRRFGPGAKKLATFFSVAYVAGYPRVRLLDSRVLRRR